ncbi:hypothetical protein VTN96DRAFT_9220 [Rasamsonia emersonii]
MVHGSCEPLSEVKNPSDVVQVIGHDSVTLKEQENIQEVAAYSDAMKSATLTRAGEWPVYGNESGLEIMRTLADLRMQVAKLNTRTELQSLRIDEQSLRIDDLARNCTRYLDVRRRTLDVYRRDILKCATTATKRRTRHGNQTVHGGDAVADADLYITRNRRDNDVFEKLYGLEVSKVSEFVNDKKNPH